MSLFGKILKGAAKLAAPVVKTALAATPAGRVVTAAGMIGGALSAGRAVVKAAPKALPAIRSLPGVGKVATGAAPVLRSVGRATGAAATGYAIYDAAGNLIGHRKKSRRVNPMNYKALKRAARRIKAARKFVKLIDSVGHPKHSGRRSFPTRSKRC